MLRTITRILAFLVCIVLLGSGVRWQIDPAGAAAGLGMDLLSGEGRSSQIGDFSAFFVVAGGFGLWGLLQGSRTLLYTPMALVGLAAVFRTTAWLVHGAAPVPVILMELVMVAILLAASSMIENPAAQ